MPILGLDSLQELFDSRYHPNLKKKVKNYECIMHEGRAYNDIEWSKLRVKKGK